jgi:oxygen-independent coproporphyrinogen-3 oxidase
MYGLPGQSVESARADVETAICFAPSHISAYHLTIEPNTLFHRFPPPLPDDDTTSAMQDAIEGRLAKAGYEHYEVSAYARRREERGEKREEDASRLSFYSSPVASGNAAYCRHNLNYWTFGDYLGIGAGAHGKLSFPGRIVRQARLRHPTRYMEAVQRGAAVESEREVAPRELGFEFMMNALRLNGGFPLRLYAERTGMPVASVLRELDEAERRGFIARDHERVAPTALGRRFLNDLLQIFLK